MDNFRLKSQTIYLVGIKDLVKTLPNSSDNRDLAHWESSVPSETVDCLQITLNHFRRLCLF